MCERGFDGDQEGYYFWGSGGQRAVHILLTRNKFLFLSLCRGRGGIHIINGLLLHPEPKTGPIPAA